jgi:hypothetical protein
VLKNVVLVAGLVDPMIMKSTRGIKISAGGEHLKAKEKL